MSGFTVRVQALDHDGVPWRELRVTDDGDGRLVAERVDAPGAKDETTTGCTCDDARSLYEFFGSEPLANYLYGRLGAPVPGLRTVVSDERKT